MKTIEEINADDMAGFLQELNHDGNRPLIVLGARMESDTATRISLYTLDDASDGVTLAILEEAIKALRNKMENP